jgi:hypothetical protein
VNDGTESAQLTDYAEEVAREVRHHASVLEASENPREVIAASNALRAAARLYIKNVLEETGWGNVFADLEDDDTANTPEVGLPPVGTPEQPPTVTYRQQHKLRIHNFDEARRLLESRSLLRNTSYCDDYDESCTGLIAGLAEVDGWQPYNYDQSVVEVVSAEWGCEIESEQPT